MLHSGFESKAFVSCYLILKYIFTKQAVIGQIFNFFQ